MGTDTRTAPAYNLSDNLMRSLVDYKMTTTIRPFKRYINCAKYYRKRNHNWLSVTENYPDVYTLIRMVTVGFADGATVCKCHVTWYVEFKALQVA